MIEDDSIVEAFDLPDDYAIDHVVIYESNDRSEWDYYAVPYILESEGEGDDYDWYHEPDWFGNTERYRQAVLDRATVNGSIKTEREFEVYSLDPV